MCIFIKSRLAFPPNFLLAFLRVLPFFSPYQKRKEKLPLEEAVSHWPDGSTGAGIGGGLCCRNFLRFRDLALWSASGCAWSDWQWQHPSHYQCQWLGLFITCTVCYDSEWVVSRSFLELFFTKILNHLCTCDFQSSTYLF